MFIYILLGISWIIILVLCYILYNRIEPWRFIVDDYRRTFLTSPVDKRQTSISEELVREIFQNYFQKSFVKIRPDWLTYKNGAPLELDGYNEELKLAFEYNGIQHYQFPSIYIKNYEEFQEQQARDKFKVEACRKNGIKLIVVPYSIKPYYMRNYLVNMLQNVEIPRHSPPEIASA